MRTFNTQAEIDSEIKGGVFRIDDDVKITFDCKIHADVWVRNIKALNIDALDIDALDIDALDIDALNIDALNIKALDIDALDIGALNIDALNIDALDIDALNIDALDINYYAYCIAYESIKCTSIKGSRPNSIHKCLDGKIIITGEENNKILHTPKDDLEKCKEEINILHQHIEALRQATHEYFSDLAAEVEKLKVQVSLIEPMTEEYKREKERALKKNQVFLNYN